MARRQGKKVKQMIKEDKFREGIVSLTKKLSDNKFFFATLLAAIILLSLGFYIRQHNRAKRQDELAQALEMPDRLPTEEMKNLMDKYSNKEFAPWLWLAYARRLFSEYREQGMKIGDKTKLIEAEKAFKTIVERFEKSGTPYLCAKEMLSVIEKEKSFDFPYKQVVTPEKYEALNWLKEPPKHTTLLKGLEEKHRQGGSGS
ncbi:MAG: hypothetical protein N2234_00250 [Planctomycetota bacterium]|nr:hypothetical protein [Planctomycetota bacterium]